ncbi:hypothetical protein NE857_31030 [Nocardiopsis exhalans]|uniref:Uncharacterized protein n=1 Tax=Nocardiopsis exhalans TaxID=163604 RepID=A0ABY5D5G9_9ACTN|nr:hypothetical protein [Nocardiopsis exhalans]USY19622.1 hypothetical protein NE857_31030 [Nocardiopsis exhalans]
MASQMWWVFASVVAWALCQVIGAPTRTEPIRPQLPPAPRRLELASSSGDPGEWGHPDEVAGALVRPYLGRR